MEHRTEDRVKDRHKISHKKFVLAYLENKTIAQCAEAAGSHSKHLTQAGYAILARDEVKRDIHRLRGEVEKMADEGWIRGVMNLVKIAQGEGVNKPSTNKEIIEAMELIGKYRGLFTHKLEVEIGVLPRISHLSEEIQEVEAEVAEGPAILPIITDLDKQNSEDEDESEES